jgi:uncharacterized repeat protein (TIGR02543 family)
MDQFDSELTDSSGIRGLVPILSDLLGDEIPTIEIFDSEVPLFGMAGGAWALVNLLLSIIGIIFAVGSIIRAFLKKKREQEYEDEKDERSERAREKERAKANEQDSEERDEHQKRFRPVWLVISVILCVAAVVLFILTEDMSLPMVLIDNWTLLHLILLVLEIIAVVIAFKLTMHTVIFEANADETFKRKIPTGDLLVEPEAPVQPNHVFAGWFTDEDYKKPWDFKDKVKKDLTLRAKWNEIRVVAGRDFELVGK